MAPERLEARDDGVRGRTAAEEIPLLPRVLVEIVKPDGPSRRRDELVRPVEIRLALGVVRSFAHVDQDRSRSRRLAVGWNDVREERRAGEEIVALGLRDGN